VNVQLTVEESNFVVETISASRHGYTTGSTTLNYVTAYLHYHGSRRQSQFE
jgi:hypothetical protein